MSGYHVGITTSKIENFDEILSESFLQCNNSEERRNFIKNKGINFKICLKYGKIKYYLPLLYYAIELNDIQLIDYLIDKDIDPHENVIYCEDQKGNTAFNLNIERGYNYKLIKENKIFN